MNSTDEKSNVQETVNSLDNQIDIPNESISQLPVVDLGEDFEFDLILNERSNVNTHIEKIHDIQNNEKYNNLVKEKHSLETWSKGHVEGLKVYLFFLIQQKINMYHFTTNILLCDNREVQI